ncbi:MULTISPECIES: sterol desaturase family protein [unclassified Synechocystis]|uniref:sterol desaturase family protein n=1 Tax=unclassified Synechocystis TaxID=2640012 RepID=UPI000405627F|nr:MULTISPECIES: sterol desaturase family protein [unclassified Synechocystis]AIE75066.1 Sterol desaturase-like protein [Synechocystis sp. PCC 6714]MCT0253232.1 sterol desaturase family protein [Synechocystis sp. CS-94]
MASLISFWLFFAFSLLQSKQRMFLASKPWQDWLLDGAGLAMQGAIIPLLQFLLVINFYSLIFPHWHHGWSLSNGGGFLFGFIVVDYIYYWVHRALHSEFLFPIHQVHHTISQMDLVSCARNTLWSSLFLPYVWLNSLIIYFLEDPRGYIFALSCTYLLDLWRHSSLTINRNCWLHLCLSSWLVLPQDHNLHHQQAGGRNFGANLKLWDKLHGTYLEDILPQTMNQFNDLQPMGIKLSLTLWQQLFWPFARNTVNFPAGWHNDVRAKHGSQSR